jgi:hypothetical protein
MPTTREARMSATHRRCGHGDGPKRALPTFEVGAGQSGADQNRAMAVAVRVRGSSARAIPATKAC